MLGTTVSGRRRRTALAHACIACHKPWAVINAAGYVRVADAEHEPELCRRENVLGPAVLAEACAERGLPLATFSSDLVFDGRAGPYVEADAVNPACIYGHAKAEAERAVLERCPAALVVRTSAFFGPWDRHNFVLAVLQALAAGNAVEASNDVVSPTYVPDLAHVVLDLLIDGEGGIWHLASPGAMSWRGFAERIARTAGFDPDLVAEAPDAPGGRLNTVLTSTRGLLLPPLETAIGRYFRDCETDWRPRGEVPAVAAE